MKNYLLCVFISLSHLLFSQTTLTQAFNGPVAGDVESTFGLDTSAYSSGLPINVIGNNVTWDFTKIVGFEPLLKDNYLSAASVPSSSNYSGCNLVQESTGLYTYLKSTTSPTTQTELLALNISSISLTFTNSAIIAKYPITYGSTSTDNLSGTFTFSVNGTFSGSITSSADGIGTLNLAMGSVLTNVIRVKSIQSINFNASLIAGFPPTQVATFKQTTYDYYSPLFKFPVISINYSKFTTVLTSSATVTGNATGSANYIVVGLKENTLNNQDVILYPNPTQSSFGIHLNNGITLSSTKLYNHLGELVLADDKNVINFSELPTGIYIAEIVTDKGSIRKKIVKE
ncbi:T9SS type A sorting domain-containing protein [Aurantibacillus circumpalustris]|uniref:T9SS type A sorting domain-containing protein n=1 Tax=Aurantibacillus circumpalustris TaxID=3036359 RepID=UPI00295BDABB|nr:T9SS type A sorting domain-containing protein [Aurantibacillus circumpalustris]